MQIKTSDGIDIFCLPDCARCEMSGKTPERMIKCPARQFDAFGDLCCPGECEYYTEEEG